VARLVLSSLQTDLNPDPSSLPFILQRLDRDGSVLKGAPGYQVTHKYQLFSYLNLLMTCFVVGKFGCSV